MSAPQPPPDLLDPNDPDWASFQSKDPEWFLKVAGDAIRVYCGWHLYPNLQLTVTNLRIGARGVIMLPATLVTAVESVTLQDPSGQNDQLLDPTQYDWFDNGVIEPIGWHWWSAYGGYYYGPDNWSFLPMYQFGLVTAVFNAGYDEVPADIKEVAYELATSTTMFSASPGTIKEIATPGFRLSPGGDFGANLSANQKNRLANYRIGAVI